MKMTRRKFLNVSTAAAVVCAATLLPVEKAAAAQQTMTAQELLEQAYLYAFPLVLLDATRKVSTNAETPNDTRAPINQFIHSEKLADAAFRTVVTPNVDTASMTGQTVRNADGSVDVTLSHVMPENTENWLPIGETEFHLFLRIYKPDWNALRGWQPPTVCVKSTQM